LIIDWHIIEKKWQNAWNESKLFEANPKSELPKFFITIAYPYPNMPFHVGHGRPYTLTDVYARFKRMQGFNVLFPMAFHYTGTPVLAIAKRIAAKDPVLLDELTRIYKVPIDVIQTFVSPLKIASYFRREMKESMLEMGYSIDWRREFTTIDPQYSKFIEWQFRKLQSKGLITQGSHPVGWCPLCGNPMGQHDTKGDVEPDIDVVIIIKFKLEDYFLPIGTLRPETLFGVTNIWVRPDIDYVKAEVNDELLIISREFAEKLRFLNKEVNIIGSVSGKSLIGQYVENPLSGKKIPILPANFVDPKNATGIVMSVPGHAPYDYIALEDLKSGRLNFSTAHLYLEILNQITPISLISLEGYSEFPALDILEQVGAVNQLDTKLEEATKKIYSKEFHMGRMKAITGKYAGMIISEAREKITATLLLEDKAFQVYTLVNRPVFCRCGAEIVVKILDDQWFLDYGNIKWKAKAYQCLNSMKIIPDDLHTEFENTIDWLRVKACARKQGMGTKLPWDTDWIIESLSDSVIYMGYYTIAKQINEKGIKAEQLNDSVFDYIFLNKGNCQTIAKKLGLKAIYLKAMREEFTYFYPLDSRHSGRDLVPNHLTFFIFNHAAIFSEALWPRQIVVTGSVLLEGKKMSKSLGNIIPLREATATYGTDPFRLAILSTAELLQDVDFNFSFAQSCRERLERFYNFAIKIINTEYDHETSEFTTIDKWLLSRLHLRVKAITDAMNNLRIREAIHEALYMLDQDIQWYLHRTSIETSIERKKVRSILLYEILKTRIRLLAPFTPHLCEEIWHEMGNTSFISIAKWPTFDPGKVDRRIIAQEAFIKAIQADTTHIIHVTKMKPKMIYYYTCPEWKWNIYLNALKCTKTETVRIATLMKKIMLDQNMRNRAKQVSKYVRTLIKNINKIPAELVDKHLENGIIDEFKILKETRDYYKQVFNVDVKVFREEDLNHYDPMNKAQLSEPYRPAIYIE
jgi:leucyl-tRNA synthetase